MSNRNRKLDQAMGTAKNMMESNVTITECVQIARGVAEDVVEDYHRTQANVQLSISIQLELLKELVISKGLITEEEFFSKYKAKAKELQEMQMRMRQESVRDSGIAEMPMNAGDVEVKTES